MCYNLRVIRTYEGDRVCRCGKCLECQKERQNDVAHRLYLAGDSYGSGSVHFWTLTYSNEHLPFLVRPSRSWLVSNGYAVELAGAAYQPSGVRIARPVGHQRFPHHPMIRHNAPFNVSPEVVDRAFNYDLKSEQSLIDLIPEQVVADIYRSAHRDEVRFKFIGDPKVGLPSRQYRDLGLHLCDFAPSVTSFRKPFNLEGELLEGGLFSEEFIRTVKSLYFTRDYEVSGNKNYVLTYGNLEICPTVNNDDLYEFHHMFRGGQRHRNQFRYKYYSCAEYGPRTDRPHYHMVTFGLTREQCDIMRARWIVRFGDRNVSDRFNLTRYNRINKVNRDGSDGFGFVCRYVGKYCSKGKYESPFVLSGNARRPRPCSSRGLWYLTPVQQDWYTGKDLLVPQLHKFLSDGYDPSFFESPVPVLQNLPDRYYTDDICARILARQHYTLHNDNKHLYKIGKSIRNKLFKYTTNERITLFDKIEGHPVRYKRRLLGTPLSRALSRFVRNKSSQVLVAECEAAVQRGEVSSYSDMVEQIRALRFSADEDRRQTAEKNSREFLSKTLF